MAKKLERKKTENPGQDDLDILHPDKTRVIGGRKITMREYGFVDGLEVRALAKAFIDDLYELLKGGGSLDTETVTHLLAVHSDVVLTLVAKAADIDSEFIHSLDDNEGQALLGLWWQVNGPFFLKKLKDRMAAELYEKRLKEKKLAAGQTCMPNSSPTDTTRTESAATPNGN